MKHAESFNFKYMTVFRKTAEKARQYQTPEEAAELEQMLQRLDSVEDESEIPEQERDRIADRCDEIIRLSTNRLIMDTFPHDLETLMQDAESDLIELDPQRIKDVWLERRKQMFGKLLQQPEPDGLSKAEAEKLMDGDTFTRSVVARCMEPYVQAFLVFGHSLELLEGLLDRYAPAQDQNDQSGNSKPKKRKQVHIGALPEQLIYPLDAVNYYAVNGSFQNGEFEAVAMFPRQYRLQNGKYTKGKPVDVFVMLEYVGTDIAQQLDQIDGAILCGIYSLLDAGETSFLASHIWEFIAGEGQKTNKTRIEDITKRVLRMTRTTAKIDFGQFAEAKGLDYTDILNVQILPGVSVKERINKRGEFIEGEIYCTQPLENFPLYRFAEATRQITRIPIRAATVRGLTTNDKPQQLTDNRIKIRETLLYRIVRKHHNKSDQVILFTTIYDKVNANSKIERQRARDAAESFLIEWAELGTIYNYSFRKKGKSFDAIVIANTPEEMQNHPGITWLAR